MLKAYKILSILLLWCGVLGCSLVKPTSSPDRLPQAFIATPVLDNQTQTPDSSFDMTVTPSTGQTSERVVSALPSAPDSNVSPIGTSAPLPASPTRTAPAPDAWKSLPVIPAVSENAIRIYQRGLQMGHDPHAFSKVGDCQSINTYFLADFETPGLYNLGPYASLQQTIDWFKGSFNRESLSVKGGFNAAAVLSPLRADPNVCNSSESPMACEYRLHNPSIALISLEEWWNGHPENYEKYMRQIIEYSIQQGVLPIVATKADNLEGNALINQTIARLAWEYDIPLWNFWAAAQPLPDHGLIEDGFHLTHGSNFNFSVKPALQTGWTLRNLTALQVLDTVQRAVSSPIH